jgi:hypothetical protein
MKFKQGSGEELGASVINTSTLYEQGVCRESLTPGRAQLYRGRRQGRLRPGCSKCLQTVSHPRQVACGPHATSEITFLAASKLSKATRRTSVRS